MSYKKRTIRVIFRLNSAEFDVLKKKCQTKSLSNYIRSRIIYDNNDVHFVRHDTFVRQKDTHDLPIVIPSLEHLCEDCGEKQKYHSTLNKWYCDSEQCRQKT